MKIPCPLCHQEGIPFYKDSFYECTNCKGLFRDKNSLPDPASEKQRYETHNNDVNDPRYQNFVSPIVQAILKDFLPGHKGLDFGAGPGPVISKLLKDRGYNIAQYDPFFFNNPSLLTQKYDYIACCEVIEHFHHPDKEFRLLKNLLKEGGRLYCMTDLYHPEIDFEKWYYKDDFTHVFIYQEETLRHIQKTFGFSGLSINGRLIQLEGSVKIET